ncbi:hypothetical protein [Bradyrhizobium ganzhouense]|uniref:hypothetical protein n=1 Tax=Bradyrhizobium ganzhouense TaxID=1179767 RepID=UPI003CF230E5
MDNQDRDQRIAELEAAVAKLTASPPAPFVPQPIPRFDPTERMGMPREVVAEMVAAEGGSMAEVIRENRVPSTAQLGRAQKVTVGGALPISNGVAPGRNGWVEPKGVGDWRPPGQAVADALLDVEDARWRAARKRELGG